MANMGDCQEPHASSFRAASHEIQKCTKRPYDGHKRQKRKIFVWLSRDNKYSDRKTSKRRNPSPENGLGQPGGLGFVGVANDLSVVPAWQIGSESPMSAVGHKRPFMAILAQRLRLGPIQPFTRPIFRTRFCTTALLNSGHSNCSKSTNLMSRFRPGAVTPPTREKRSRQSRHRRHLCS